MSFVRGYRGLIFLSLTGSFCFSFLHGTLFHEIDTTRLLKCTFSSVHHNRIAVDNGRIKKVMYLSDQLYISSEEESGQVFIQSKETLTKPTTISVVTSNGLVQDIEISFKDAPTEVIILREPAVSENKDAPEHDTPFCFELTTRENIDAILEGTIPEKYTKQTFDGKAWTPKKGLSGNTFLKLKGPADTLYVFEIENTSRKNLCLSEEEIACGEAKWVYLERNFIAPSEKIMGVIARDE